MTDNVTEKGGQGDGEDTPAEKPTAEKSGATTEDPAAEADEKEEDVHRPRCGRAPRIQEHQNFSASKTFGCMVRRRQLSERKTSSIPEHDQWPKNVEESATRGEGGGNNFIFLIEMQALC